MFPGCQSASPTPPPRGRRLLPPRAHRLQLAFLPLSPFACTETQHLHQNAALFCGRNVDCYRFADRHSGAGIKKARENRQKQAKTPFFVFSRFSPFGTKHAYYVFQKGSAERQTTKLKGELT